MISQLVAAIRHIDPEITDKDIADALWLALQIRKAVGAPELDEEIPLQSDATLSETFSKLLHKDKTNLTPTSKPFASTPRSQSPKSGLYPNSSQGGSGGQSLSVLPFRSPSATALPGSLDIARVLRPFGRRVRQRGTFVLNEEATAKRIAEEDIWVPILDYALTHWLDVALVIDIGSSMTIWRQTITELHRLLARHGAFRDVRLWELDTNDAGVVRLYAGTGVGIDERQPHGGLELIDASGRRLILVVTDCVSAAWHSGAVTDILAKWGGYNSVTIVQVLPQRLWSRTALGMAAPVRLHVPAPGTANRQLHVQATQYWDDEESLPTIPIPIVTLEPKPLSAWSRAIAKAEDLWIPGFELVIPSQVAEKQEQNGYALYEEAVSIKLSAAERVQRFRANASSPARRLAGLLAIVPITLPIIRLVQQAMFHEPLQAHVAEVFLSGLLEVISPSSDTLDPEDVQYDFVDGAREILLNSIPPNDSSRVLAEITAFITSKFAHPLDFGALLANPLVTEGVVIDKENRPFALMGAKALRRFGGEYVALADWLEEESSKSEEQDDRTGMDAGVYVLEGEDGQEQMQREGTLPSEQVVVGDRVADDSVGIMTQEIVESGGMVEDVTEIAESIGAQEGVEDDTTLGYIHDAGIEERINEKNLVEKDKSKGRRLALVIGVDQTRSYILPTLNCAVSDAQEVADVLVQRCQFSLYAPPLLGEQATSGTIKRAVAGLARQRSAGDLLLFYFSGHGQQAYDELDREIRRTYLGSADFNEEEVEEDPNRHISLHWLRERLFEKTDAGRVLVVLDCSYAEDIRTRSDHTLDELRSQLQEDLEIPGAEVNKRRPGLYAALAAAGYNQTAGEADGHSLMTGLLLKALRGEEPALVGRRGEITLNSLLDYITIQMPEEYKPVISYTNSTGQQCVLVTYPELARRSSHQLLAERPTSYIPFMRNTLFQSRPGEFEDLERLLLPSGTTQSSVRIGLVGVTGMGGIGKTQLAVEFAYRYQQRFPGGIFWMLATGHSLFDWQRHFAELAFNADYLPADDDPSHPENERNRARHLCRYLAQHADALLILDNVEEPDLVTSALPALAGSDVRCAILYTSRLPSAPHDVRLHRVERLPPEAALRLLLETTRPQTWAEIAAGHESAETRAARQVCERVGYLPLALVHLRGRLVQDEGATLVRMAEALRQGRLAGLNQVLFETFRWSWERIHDETTRRLFLLACSFPEETPIPLRSLGLAAGLGERVESFEPLGEACLQLQAANLFERLSNEQVRLHPLVREFGQDLLAAQNELIESSPSLYDNMPSLEEEIHLAPQKQRGKKIMDNTADSMHPSTAFLSYRRQDPDTGEVEYLQQQLHLRGVRAWRDVTHMEISRPSKDEITHAIGQQVDAFLLYITPRSLHSDFVWDIEVRAALERWRSERTFSIVPVLHGVSKDELRRVCADRRCIDLTKFNWHVLSDPASETVVTVNEQIRDVAKRMLQATLKLRLQRVGADQSSYEPCLCLHTEGYTPKTNSLDLDLNWAELFKGGRWPTEGEWQEMLLPALYDVKEALNAAPHSRTLHVFVRAQLPVALALGFVFPLTADFKLVFDGKSPPWSTEGITTDKEPLSYLPHSLEGDTRSAVVEIAVTRDVTGLVTKCLPSFGLSYGYRLQFLVDEPGPDFVKDASHALAIARQVGRELRQLCDRKGVTDFHIFIACPAELAVLLGHQLNALGKITIYQHMKGEEGGAYKLGCVLRH